MRLIDNEINYKIIPPQLGLQRNALRIEVIPPMIRCMLQPKTWQAVIIRDTRPFHVEQSWCDFDYCVRDKCEDCPIRKAYRERTKYQNTVIRRDPINPEVWHFMSRQKRGFGEYSYWYKGLPLLVGGWSVHLADAERDEHGTYYPALAVDPESF
jgi:hypothetical protein